MKSHMVVAGYVAEEERQADVLVSAESYLAVSYIFSAWPEEPLSTWMVPGTYQIIGGPHADVHAN